MTSASSNSTSYIHVPGLRTEESPDGFKSMPDGRELPLGIEATQQSCHGHNIVTIPPFSDTYIILVKPKQAA